MGPLWSLHMATDHMHEIDRDSKEIVRTCLPGTMRWVGRRFRDAKGLPYPKWVRLHRN